MSDKDTQDHIPGLVNLGQDYVDPEPIRATYAPKHYHPQNVERIQVPGCGRKALYMRGKRWYFRLVDKDEYDLNGRRKYRPRALMKDYNEGAAAGHLVICYSTEEHGRLYAFFEDYLEFAEYQANIPVHKRSFFEIIMGRLPQKPHFDIDISQKELTEIDPDADIDEVAEEVKDNVIYAITQIIPDITLEKDILVFSSHGVKQDDEGYDIIKKSFHIVVNNYCHDDNKEAEAFYEMVLTYIPTYKSFIDRAVYKSKQQFRILGSQKIGSNRPKIFNTTFTYKGEQITHVLNEQARNEKHRDVIMLYESLVTFISMCTCLPPYVKEGKANKHYSTRLTDYEDIPVDTARMALNLLAKTAGMSCDDYRFPYTINNIDGHLICLKRHRPSYCRICKRVHENEHPYMYLIGPYIYWNCRRADKGASLRVGALDGETYKSISEQIVNTLQDAEDDNDGKGQLFLGDFMSTGGDSNKSDEEETKEVKRASQLRTPQLLDLRPPPLQSLERNVLSKVQAHQSQWAKNAAERYFKKKNIDADKAHRDAISSAAMEVDCDMTLH